MERAADSRHRFMNYIKKPAPVMALLAIALTLTVGYVYAAGGNPRGQIRNAASLATYPSASPAPSPSPSPSPLASPNPPPFPSQLESAGPAGFRNKLTQAPPPGSTAGFVTRNGTTLLLNGQPYRFTGVNAYEAATYWGINAGCGGMLKDQDLDTLFGNSLRPGQVVRFWAFQGLATNYATKQRDWTGIDRVLTAAAQHRVKVIPALSDQVGTCDDGHWRDVAWYSGGYMNTYESAQNITPESFWQYMHEFLSRYRSNPAIAMIELVNEPSPTNPGYVCVNQDTAATALRSFYDTVGSEAKRVDPNHLFESGQQGVGQCGQQNQGCSSPQWTSCSTLHYAYVDASPGVDVTSYHDYEHDGEPIPGYLQESLAQAGMNGKPLIVGEMGMKAHDNLGGCMSLGSRAGNVAAKLAAQFGAGVQGVLVWDFVPGVPRSTCDYDMTAGDPVLGALR